MIVFLFRFHFHHFPFLISSFLVPAWFYQFPIYTCGLFIASTPPNNICCTFRCSISVLSVTRPQRRLVTLLHARHCASHAIHGRFNPVQPAKSPDHNLHMSKKGGNTKLATCTIPVFILHTHYLYILISCILSDTACSPTWLILLSYVMENKVPTMST